MIIDLTKGKGKLVLRPHIQTFLDLGFLNTHDTWLAGGAIRAAFVSEEIADYDMFFGNSLAAAKVEVELESLGAETIFKCPQGKLTTMKYQGMKIQLITEFFYFDMNQLIDSFDITACRFATDGNVIVTRYSSIRDTWKRQINLHRVDFPVATMKRIAKYIKKGYKLTNTAATSFVNGIYDRGRMHLELDDRVYID